MKATPKYNDETGLVPVITQDAFSNEVLMLAWMNKEAWEKTLQSGVAVYWSRSRNCLWKKGERSGRTQKIQEIFLDCDKDSILLKVKQIGDSACHTGRRSCFHNRVENGNLQVVGKILFNPKEVYQQ